MNAVYGHAPKPPGKGEATARLQEILCNRIKTTPPAAHLIGIERRGLRQNPDNHQFSFRVELNEVPLDAIGTP